MGSLQREEDVMTNLPGLSGVLKNPHPLEDIQVRKEHI